MSRWHSLVYHRSIHGFTKNSVIPASWSMMSIRPCLSQITYQLSAPWIVTLYSVYCPVIPVINYLKTWGKYSVQLIMLPRTSMDWVLQCTCIVFWVVPILEPWGLSGVLEKLCLVEALWEAVLNGASLNWHWTCQMLNLSCCQDQNTALLSAKTTHSVLSHWYKADIEHYPPEKFLLTKELWASSQSGWHQNIKFNRLSV